MDTSPGPLDPATLGAYVLPGKALDPRRGLADARAAEAMGLGAVWVGERY
ncbi:MAG: hypothetical protein JWL64_1816, partial [Frankiales bacterium]|nr:hypothetical protein [Frankiales bacterium]